MREFFAGFLVVTDDCENGLDGPKKKKKKVVSEPLDRTIIHPSQYGVARRWAQEDYFFFSAVAQPSQPCP